MTQKEKLGIGVIVGFFMAMALILYLTMDRPTKKGGSFENNVIIDQRVRNLNK